MKKTIQILVSCVIGFLLLWLVFHGTDWKQIYSAIAGANMFYLALIVGFILLSFVTRVQRWTYIVRATQPASFRHLFSATQIGFLANFILPLRMGEPLRALALTRLIRIPFTASLATLALDRVTDLVCLLPILLIAVLTLPSQQAVQIPAGTFEWLQRPLTFNPTLIAVTEKGLVIFLVALIGLLVLLYVNQPLALRVSDAVLGRIAPNLARRVHQMLEHFAQGLHVFRSAADMAKSLFFSALTWGISLFFWVLLLRAFHLDCPWTAPFLLQAVVAAAVSIPGPPGFIGQFHLAVVLALLVALPDTDPNAAKAIAIVVHAINLIPIALTGLPCLYFERHTLFARSRPTPPPAS